MVITLDPASFGRTGWSCVDGSPVVQICSGSSPVWGGVLCDAGSVVSIALARLGMAGTIPSSVGLLSRLTKLDLRSNSIQGIIPSSFGNMKRIQTLRLDSNKLSGSVPSSICSNMALTNINVADNALSCYESCLSTVPTRSFGCPQCTAGVLLLIIVDI